jgi:YD repeat-containing protein
LRELHDALARVTKWKHDVQGRVTAKVFPDNSTVLYGYDLSSRLATITDASGQARSLTYNRDDTMAAEKYLNAIHPTPEVGFSWNGTIRRLDAVSDGAGATKFTYHPYGSVGGERGRATGF